MNPSFARVLDYINNDALSLMEHVEKTDICDLDSARTLEKMHILEENLLAAEHGQLNFEGDDEDQQDMEYMQDHMDYCKPSRRPRVPKAKQASAAAQKKEPKK